MKDRWNGQLIRAGLAFLALTTIEACKLVDTLPVVPSRTFIRPTERRFLEANINAGADFPGEAHQDMIAMALLSFPDAKPADVVDFTVQTDRFFPLFFAIINSPGKEPRMV